MLFEYDILQIHGKLHFIFKTVYHSKKNSLQFLDMLNDY